MKTSAVKGTGWTVTIGGFRGVSIEDVDGFLDRLGEAVSPAVFQVFDASKVAGWGHLYYSVVNAVEAHRAGTAISRSLEIEVLLYASCQDQISQALDLMGVRPETEEVALVVLSEDNSGAEEAFKRGARILGEGDDSALEVTGDKLERLLGVFGISARALGAVGGPREEALTKLLIERGALLPLRH
ncbi:MAG: KEOPS complex subunit Cgi121 [Candidatus Bathyarchaeota archaeon]